jgi:DNA (cytosine-5)-methyltransferase 1
LIYEVYRLLLTSEKPKILIMENVANICNTTFMPQFTDWINSLSELGYTSSWQKIKAFQYGGATIRERVFMISVLNTDIAFKFPNAITPSTTLKDFLEPVDKNYYIDVYSGPPDITTPYYSGAKKLIDYNNGGQGNRIYSILGQGVTLTASGGGKAGSSGGLYLREGDIYKLSPIEMCKVMGWSKEDAEKICSALTPREVGFCMGNAIDRTVLIHIFKSIINQYF